MKIKDVEIKNRTALAPMAGVNCTAFRLLCRKLGAGLIFTQMYDVHIIIQKYKDGTLSDFLNIQEESPLALQLIGNASDNWEEAVKIVEKYADIIDINFGCGEPEYIEKKAGCYLMKEPEQIRAIIKRCVSATNKPITAKIRSGWDSESINAVKVAKIIEEAGASAISIHPRTKEQKYADKADWGVIKRVKEAVSIPVIGSGDISLPGHAKAMVEQTKCDGVMLGRAAMRNPEMFEYINYILEHGRNKKEITDDTKNAKKLIKEFIFFYKKFEKRSSLNEVKNHCIWLLHKTKGAPQIKAEVKKANSIDEIKEIIV